MSINKIKAHILAVLSEHEITKVRASIVEMLDISTDDILELEMEDDEQQQDD